MASDDVMLIGVVPRGIIQFGNAFYFLEELIECARKIQQRALRAKLTGSRHEAILLYRELIPYLDKLDDLDAFELPRGLQTQVARRTIEQLESCAA